MSLRHNFFVYRSIVGEVVDLSFSYHFHFLFHHPIHDETGLFTSYRITHDEWRSAIDNSNWLLKSKTEKKSCDLSTPKLTFFHFRWTERTHAISFLWPYITWPSKHKWKQRKASPCETFYSKLLSKKNFAVCDVDFKRVFGFSFHSIVLPCLSGFHWELSRCFYIIWRASSEGEKRQILAHT